MRQQHMLLEVTAINIPSLYYAFLNLIRKTITALKLACIQRKFIEFIVSVKDTMTQLHHKWVVFPACKVSFKPRSFVKLNFLFSAAIQFFAPPLEMCATWQLTQLQQYNYNILV